MMSSKQSGFTLIEMMVVITVIGIVSSFTYLICRDIADSNGYIAAKDLRDVWLRQRIVLSERLSTPSTAANTFTKSDLYSTSTTLPSEKFGTINYSQIPPIFSLDGTRNDEPFTGFGTGDGIYDIGKW